MIVHASSWHFRLLRAFDVNTFELEDSCKYIRKVMTVLAFSIVLATAVMVVVGDFIAWGLAILIGGFTPPGIGATIVLFSLVVAVILLTIAGSAEYYQNWKSRQPYKPEPPPSFAKQAYHQWRDKFCTRVDIIR